MAEPAAAAIHSVQSGALCWAGHAALAASKPHHGQQVEEDNGGSGEPWPVLLPALGIPTLDTGVSTWGGVQEEVVRPAL